MDEPKTFVVLGMFRGERFPPAKEYTELDPDGDGVNIGWSLGVTDGIPQIFGPYDDSDVAQSEADALMLATPDGEAAYMAWVLPIEGTTVAAYLE